ncbi:glycogen synthase GlgA [Mariprofundus erugo]|uniref:Glycogen synthase n=1 Tax=Mariprofundus erugo TaxID=2528639 RepID=A0A5R9GLW4_9PROT|nr:glycogen synthase GlgA [Mariprofundus erugo]TLS65989.1 glycogen synthase GlgA [Mariprofundus erugo]TLS76354.1 glycogen synthase GlgA [Mariprofundus erugo]
MAGLNIVFIASEASPLAKTGGLADVTGSLPRALMNQGHELTIIMPYYRRQMQQTGIEATSMHSTIEMWADGVRHHCPLHQVYLDGLRYILIEQDALFNRDGIYGPPGGAYEDNFLRFLLFSRVALEAAAQLDRPVDILHCHDWQTGMIPVLLKTQYQHQPKIAHAKTVYTIHNLAYQGVFPVSWMHRLGLPSHHFHPGGFEFHGQINCMKAAIADADALTTVSPTYAEEILTPEYGCHLEGFLHHHTSRLSGIVNGLDIEQWDPETDTQIAACYGANHITGKKQCKQELQQHCNFPVAADIPVLTLISRLADQKGIDLVLANAGRWIERGYQIVVLGSGDSHTEHRLHELANHHPSNMYFWRGFNETLARQIYAGGDIFLMPSRFEPCGLGQLMAMRYGTVPVVRATGGLKDTVIDHAVDPAHATGFHFSDATPHAFDEALESAIAAYRQPHHWAAIRTRTLKRDSSWDASAAAYSTLYARLLGR